MDNRSLSILQKNTMVSQSRRQLKSINSELVDKSIKKKDNSRPGDTLQRVCYSVKGNGTHDGDTAPKSGFTNQDTYYKDGVVAVNFNSTRIGVNELDGSGLVPTSDVTHLVGQVDHIVPANLGGGALDSNGRLIDAKSNMSRGDNFTKFNPKFATDDIVIVADNNKAYETATNAMNYGGAAAAQIKYLHDQFPAIWGPTKRFQMPK
ncbi:MULTISPECIES: hypothetical protein [unclassified Pseudoalteromonas]|uniref:hypothetical protein n=1 Tax=unclassified Pseudoalteromonas TaxID=194690 RepID=UPI00301CD2FE